MRLNELNDNEGARKRRLRVGRGIGSGKGKTAGRGHKGQKSRTGVSISGFEGGQMPLYMRLPKRGFRSMNRARVGLVNLRDLQAAVDAKKVKAGAALDMAALKELGLVRSNVIGVRLLGKGELNVKLSLTVDHASAAAKAAVEKAGGSVTVTVTSAPAAAEG